MESIDSDFPVFVLSMIIVERSKYESDILPKLNELKLRYWDHEGINIHSRDIRKAYGDFGILKDSAIRKLFLGDISDFVESIPFTLFISAIRKDLHKEKYGKSALNPYSLALEFTMERILQCMENIGESELPIIAEARGRNEDRDLRAAFQQLMQNGTRYHSADRFRRLKCPLTFRRKYDNIAGMQIADLCAHPCARHILKPEKSSVAFQSVRPHIYRKGKTNGWKVFP